MEAGREMDAMIAERVMGWIKRRQTDIPHYSTDIAAAFAVVEEMDCGFIQWDVGIFEVELTKECITGFATADTLPLAICRAALKAIEEEA